MLGFLNSTLGTWGPLCFGLAWDRITMKAKILFGALKSLPRSGSDREQARSYSGFVAMWKPGNFLGFSNPGVACSFSSLIQTAYPGMNF